MKSELADPVLSVNSFYNEDTTYNEKLNSAHVDVPGNEDSVTAELVMIMSSKVGSMINPKHLIVLFRIQKALTSLCLLLTILAEVTWIIIMIIIEEDLLNIVGGKRDAMLRGFGIVLSILALLIEQDIMIVEYIPIMKFFLMRFCMISFISCLSKTHPAIGQFGFLNEAGTLNFSGFYGFTILFQTIAAYSLLLCSFTYLIWGMLCLDRFTADAFLAEEDMQIQSGINGNITMTDMDGDIGEMDNMGHDAPVEKYGPASDMSIIKSSNGDITIQTNLDKDNKDMI